MSEYRERFLLVTFIWSTPKVDQMNTLFNSALDWIKLTDNTWILWTNINAGEWYPYIKSRIDSSGDSVLIAELNLATVDVNYGGWHKKLLWEWIDKHR